MPVIGDIRKATNIGYKGTCLFIWQPCELCHKERWVRISAKGVMKSLHCISCAGKFKAGKHRGNNSYNWKGGRFQNVGGYICVWISPDDFFYPMADSKGYVLEHRLIMAKLLGRCLTRWELVHHKNGIKDDNRQENLELSYKGGHISSHSQGYRTGYIKGLRDGHLKQIRELNSRIKQLEDILIFERS